MPFHWPVSYCFSEHTCRPSPTTQPWCAFGCTSRKILNTTDICLTAARGQMRAELMRTRGSRGLPTCAASRNRPIALPGELVCGRLKVSCVNFLSARSLVVTAHYNTSVSEQIPVRAVWSSSTAQSYRARSFGCREYKVPLTPILFLIQLTDLLFYYCYKLKGFF